MSLARRTEISTVYEGKNISAQINQHMKSFQFEDAASGSSDAISIGLRDDEGLWMGPWCPTKGDSIKSTIVFLNWDKDSTRRILDCGIFNVDGLSFSGRPRTATIKAASIPQSKAFNTEERSKTWEKITVRQIAEEIASRSGVALYYEADSISIESIEQDTQTDCKFLYALCQDYGLAMKVYENRIIIFDEEKYENAVPIVKLKEKDLIKWDYNTEVAGTYTGATLNFTDPNDDKEYKVDIGGGDRILKINVTADSIYDAELKGIAKLNQENKKGTTLTVTIMANPSIVAGMVVQIEEMGVISGKYYIDKNRTKITAGAASEMTLNMHRVVARIKNASARAVDEAREEKQAEGEQYTVKSGDSLWSIAKEKLGNGAKYILIYDANKDVIEAEAREHGKSDSGNGKWIWPGTVLIIPAQ